MKAICLALILFFSIPSFGHGFNFLKSPEANASPDFQFSTGNSGYYSSPVYFGGNFSYFPNKTGMFVSVSPIIGARITNRFHLGLSAGIRYEREQITFYEPWPDSTNYQYESAYYDVSLFARYFLNHRFFLHLEPEVINLKNATIRWDYPTGKIIEEAERKNITAGLVGIGFAAPIGQQSILVLTVLYDIRQHELAPYGPYPFLRGGFNLGF